MATNLYQDGYRVGRYNLEHMFTFTKPPEYVIGWQEGRRRRRMQLAIEFTAVSSIIFVILVLAAWSLTANGVV
jgi:hypothetical protein